MKKIILAALIYIAILQLKDSAISFKASLLFGFLVSVWNEKFLFKDRLISYLLMIAAPISALLIISYIHDIELTYRPILAWPGVLLLSAALGVGYSKLKMKRELKVSLFLSFLLLLVVPFFKKFNEGTYACLAMICYITAGLYVLITNKDKPLLAITYLFTPYFLVHLAVPIMENDYTGFILYLPPLIVSIGLLLILISRHVVIPLKLSFKPVVSFILLLALIWPLQENYAAWIYSFNNPATNDTFQFQLVNIDGETLNSSEKKVNVFLFTSAYCGNCYKEYPYFSELAARYSIDSSVAFYATFLKFRDKDTTFYKELVKNNYSFNWTMASESEAVYSELKMEGVPSLLILTDENKILYHGYCHPRPWIFVNSPERLIRDYLD